MKKLISLFLICIIFSTQVFANTTCDWKIGITPGPNKTFIYSEACHQQVGLLIQENLNLTQQVSDLNQAIQLKNLALTNSDARVALWEKSSMDEYDKLNKISSESKTNEWVFFGLGVLTTVGAAYAASQLIHR